MEFVLFNRKENVMCGFDTWSFFGGIVATFCACGAICILLFVVNGWNADEELEGY